MYPISNMSQALLYRLYQDDVFGRKALLPNSPCAIIPSDFVRVWRTWLWKPGDFQRPSGLDNSFLLCEHGNLNVDLRESLDFDDDLAVVSLDEWQTLQTL